jgi:hypothetical protein
MWGSSPAVSKVRKTRMHGYFGNNYDKTMIARKVSKTPCASYCLNTWLASRGFLLLLLMLWLGCHVLKEPFA